MSHFRPALVLLLLFTLLFGIAYPFAITGMAQAAFPAQANGSLIQRNGQVVGSSLIGQQFNRADYFWPRPSAAGHGYDASASSGSNYGATSQALVDRVSQNVTHLRESGVATAIPADLATASGSGLDPHISPAAAEAQVARVATARRMSPDQIQTLVAQNVEPPFLGFLGDPTVNVLRLNLALDELGAARR